MSLAIDNSFSIFGLWFQLCALIVIVLNFCYSVKAEFEKQYLLPVKVSDFLNDTISNIEEN